MKARKGMTLAGGADTRRHPMAMAMSTSKQRMPAYDKPTIRFPLATLMHAKTREILIISSGQDLPLFRQLPGDGGPGGIPCIMPRPGSAFMVVRLAISRPVWKTRPGHYGRPVAGNTCCNC